MDQSTKIYNQLPVWAQNTICTLYGYKEYQTRFTKTFDAYLEFLLKSERFTSQEISNYQDEQLQSLVKYSYEHVEFYNNLFKANKLTPSDIKSKNDLYKLPVLTKEDVRKAGKALISDASEQNKLIHKHTSGTTGKSLSFYTSAKAISFQWAVWWRHRNRFGVNLKDWHLNFTGKLVTPAQQNRPPYWRWNLPMHQALINMQHLQENKILSITEFIDKNNFKFFSGYPSIISDYCSKAIDLGLSLTNKPRYIFTGAENILDYQRNVMSNFTDAVISDQYGFTEGCGNASQCEHFNYHEDFEFGIIECADGVEKDGLKTGKIICTGFANYDFPFIRYEVGDIGTWSNEKCKCGRQSAVLKRIEGRIDDFVLTPEGNKIMRFDYIFKEAINVKECQVVQEKLGEVKLRIVKRSGYNKSDELTIKKLVSEWISKSIEVKFDYVNEIEKSNTGKFKAVVSNIK